jgi:hypothetical protein
MIVGSAVNAALIESGRENIGESLPTGQIGCTDLLYYLLYHLFVILRRDWLACKDGEEVESSSHDFLA